MLSPMVMATLNYRETIVEAVHNLCPEAAETRLVLFGTSTTSWIFPSDRHRHTLVAWALLRFILLFIYEVPPLCKMGLQVIDNGTGEVDGNIRPPHTTICQAIKLVRLPITDVLKVHLLHVNT